MPLVPCISPSQVDKNAEVLNIIFSRWSNKHNIKKRFTKNDGIFDKEMAERNLRSWAEDILDVPFAKEFTLTGGQVERLNIAMDSYNRDLNGRFKNIAGLFATPRGLARLDPTSNRFLMKLESMKNYERNRVSYLEFSTQDIRDLILSAHIKKGMGSKWFGNKSYREFRKLRDNIFKARDETELIAANNDVKDFLAKDKGRLLDEYNKLIILKSRSKPDEINELSRAVEKGYTWKDPVTLEEKSVQYDPKIVQAVLKTHKLLDKMGDVNIKSFDRLKDIITHKYSRFDNKHIQLVDMLDSASKRIKKGIEEGNYFPKVTLESMHQIRQGLEKILPENDMGALRVELNNLSTITEKIYSDLNKIPENTRASNRSNLNVMWEKDPFVVIEKYSRDAVQFNKNIHIQAAYLEAMRDAPTRDTPFLRGMRSFIIEEYAVANEGARRRPEWINDLVRNVNGFQTARTMGLNITGGVKNFLSISHYLSKVGIGAVRSAERLYQDETIGRITDTVEKEEGFLFTPRDSAIILEGTIGRDKYKDSELRFNDEDGQFYLRDTRLRDLMENAKDVTLSKLLFFHRITENYQRKKMFRTSFITKLNELMSSGMEENVSTRFAKNFALKMVNGWAYEYAPFAKNKYVRGSQDIIVDELEGSYIVKNQVPVTKSLKGGLSEIAFHLLHYPLSLLETHMSEVKGAGQSIMAGQYNLKVNPFSEKGSAEWSPELQYMLRYAGMFGLINLSSILLNVNFNNILENETLDRIGRIEKDILEHDSETKATFGLLSEFTGPTIGHLKYFSIAKGLVDMDDPFTRIMLGNVDYTENTEDVLRYTDYQWSTEYGRLKNKILPAIRDGRGVDVLRHYLALYPSDWIKSARRSLGLKKSSTSKYSTEQVLSSLTNFAKL